MEWGFLRGLNQTAQKLGYLYTREILFLVYILYMYTCITSSHEECISYPQHGDVQGSTVGWDLGVSRVSNIYYANPLLMYSLLTK